MARQEPLTEREVREALGLSHRAASLALAEAESWGIVERVPEPRRVGRRGPAGAAYLAVGDHWQWFGRVIAERKVREGDPIVAVLEAKEREAAAALGATIRTTAELAALRDWLVGVPRLRPPVRPGRRARPAARAARARACPQPPRADPGRDDPAPVRPARRAAGPGRHRPRRCPLAPVADCRAPRDEADVGGRPDRRPLDGRARAHRPGRGVTGGPLAAVRARCDNRRARGARPTRTGDDPGARPGRRSEREQPEESLPHDRRDVHLGDQEGSRPDAQGRRHHGRRHARSGQDRRGCRRGRRDGARARPGRHPQGRRRRPHVRSRR